MSLLKSLLISFGFFLMLCHPLLAADKIIAKVNNGVITEDQFNRFIKLLKTKNPSFEVTDDNRKIIVDELINRELMYQEANRQKVDKEPDIAYIIEQQRVDTMIQSLIKKKISEKPATDEELKKLYEERIVGKDAREYKARHILLQSEDEAKSIILQLNAGRDFSKLAKERSVGPSRTSGGDLGWFSEGRMVPEFIQAISGMEKGTYSKTPVKTRFGWHVIKLEDIRKKEPPTFESVKKQLEGSINKQRLSDYISNLRNQAKITINK